MENTLHRRARWVYERIHFDETPIDVLVMGSSRTAAAVDPLQLSDTLSSIADHRVHVANFAFAQPGVDLTYFILREALETRPVKVAVIGVSEHGGKFGHPAFKDLADVSDLLRAPPLINEGYWDEESYIPMRQLKLAADTLLAGALGYKRDFDRSKYLGSDIDMRHVFPFVQGTHAVVDPKALEAESRLYRHNAQLVHLPASLADVEFAAERVYMRRLKRLAAAHHTKLVFVYLPFYKGSSDLLDWPFYKSIGPVVLPPESIFDDPKNFMDVVHLNDGGAKMFTRWLAQTLGPDFHQPTPTR